MKTITSVLILFITSQLVSGQAAAKKIDSICRAISNKNPEVAISIGFVENGTTSFFNYGKISKESKVAVDENTIYEIGSVTKLLTGNLIAQANNEGKLKIDDFIDDYLPKEYVLSKEIKGTIKISDLASHQSGLPNFDFKKLMELNPKQPLDISKESVHALINENTKLIDYGSYRYSNISYTLMGMILEKVYAKSFEEVLKEKILLPAKMENTLTSSFNVKNKVTGYEFNGAAQDFFNWNSLIAPAGLLKSNTADLTKLLKILLSNKGEIAKATPIAETTFFKNTEREVGFGQQMERNGDDVYFYKTGNTMGCASIFAYDKKSNWGMVILLNHNNSNLIGELINTNYDQVLKKKQL
ncbi:serine hydrolase domain-containing protein [Flavobacterium sp. MC2016-06]|uniref:serine hydrolase domain-containing protein n=1 Tax=Flavobacterium sp. MC2016-06 TaxID=2676308 RepID=UPI0012BA96CF|nr:serine hydrolase domain-containing protein [Flavobacterium sp. MC2016-06]MBU3859270.1 beta-lactamase family protein [Flavobacterium sp. MC2016-06]